MFFYNEKKEGGEEMPINAPVCRLQTIDLYENEEALKKVVSALSVKARRDILRLINEGPRCINDVAWKLNMPVSTASFHIKVLVDAGLLIYSSNTKKRGKEKIVTLGNYLFTMYLGKEGTGEIRNEMFSIDIPIGSYTDFSVKPTCGIMLSDGILLVSDTPAVFCSPQRFEAGLIWLKQGYLEYTVPMLDYFGSRENVLKYINKNTIQSVGFQFEICSEAAPYDQDYKSDITFSVNGTKLCVIQTTGDFGERRGRLNPPRISDAFTQYGLLQSIDIRYDGTYLNEKRVSDFCVDDLALTQTDVLRFRIAVEEDAKHVGGFNLFGKSFGDYPQDIILNISYRTRKNSN